MSLFFSHTQNSKMELIHYLLFHDYSATTQELSLALDISGKSVTRYCQALNEEFKEIPEGHLFLLENDKGIINLTFPPKTVPSYLLDHLRILYAKNSVKFTIIDALLSGKYDTISELADSLYLAPTTIYNHLYQLESVLKQFDLSFNWERQAQGLNFNYDEKKIRFFSFRFYWRFFKGIIPIKHEDDLAISEQIADTYFPEEEFLVKKRQLSYIIQITKWHVSQTHPVYLRDSSKKILRLMVKVSDHSQLVTMIELTEDEKLFFNLFTRIIISSMDNFDEKTMIVESLKNCELDVFEKFTQLHDSLVHSFNCSPTEEDSINFYYHMTLLWVTNKEIGIEVDNQFSLSFNTAYYQNADLLSPNALTIMQNAYQKKVMSDEKKSINEDTAIQVCWNLVTHHYVKEKISIAISFSFNLSGEATIKNRLRQIFNSDMLEFTNQMTKADLVISDCTYIPMSSQDFFYMEYISDPVCWENLFEFLKNKLAQQVL